MFLAMAQDSQVLKAVGLTRKDWRVEKLETLTRTEGGHECGGVSADGRMALSNDSDVPGDQLYTQPLILRIRRRRSGCRGERWTGHPRPSISQIRLPGNVRFVVYANSAGCSCAKSTETPV